MGRSLDGNRTMSRIAGNLQSVASLSLSLPPFPAPSFFLFFCFYTSKDCNYILSCETTMSVSIRVCAAICVALLLVIEHFRRLRGTRCTRIAARVSSTNAEHTIPKVIFMTTNIDLSHVPDLLKHTAKGYDVYIYDDSNARTFLQKVWGRDTVKRFDALKKGAHKMDLWRYCVLYTYGGVYLDIKTIPMVNISDAFTQSNTWYTCLSAIRGCYQGIIATPKSNDILLECIRRVMTTTDAELASNYLLLTTQMHEVCKQVYGDPCSTAGNYPARDNQINVPDLELFQETCSSQECRFTKRDQYGLCCNIQNSKARHMFRTRHEQYPWKKLPSGETSLLHRENLHMVT